MGRTGLVTGQATGQGTRPAKRVTEGLLAKAIRGARITLDAALRPDTAPAVLGALLFVIAFLAISPMAGPEPPYSTAVYAADGELLGAMVAADGQWRLPLSAGGKPPPAGGKPPPAGGKPPVSGEQLPERFAVALAAYEDSRFYGHPGFDAIAIFRAFRDNLAAGRIVSGGSTISMQLARLRRGAGQRTLYAKLVEMVLAVRMELSGRKDDILAAYAGLAPFGGNVVGIQAAGFRWFGHDSAHLTWAEAAVLAVLPNSPALVHPGRSRDELGRKRDALLYALASRGAFDPAELPYFLAEPLPGAPLPMPGQAPHLAAKAGPGRVQTSLDYQLQLRAQAVAERHAQRLGSQGIANAAAVLMSVADGRILAYVGNVRAAGEDGSWQVDCAAAPRSSGSIFKPFLYAAMLDSGELTPTRLVPDIPTRIGSYSPENNLKTYAGAVRAQDALARSLNVPFVRLLRSYGIERFADLLKRFGFSHLSRAPADYGLTLILGGAEASLVEAAAAFARLARAARPDGSALPGTGGDLDIAGSGVAEGNDTPVSRAAAWLTLEALVDVARPGEDASWQEYASSRRIAWKTGTSFGSRDAWAIGVTQDYVVAVWAGNASGQGRPEIKGTDTAAPLMFDLFQLLPRSAWFPEPVADLRMITVCADSGYAAGPACPATQRIAVPAQAHVDEPCPYCRIVHLSDDGALRVSAGCAGVDGLVAVKRFVLPPAIEWYYRRSTIGYRPLPPWKPGCTVADATAVDLVAPENGALLYIPIELDGSFGMTVFRAVHRDASQRLFWHLDGDYLGETSGDHRLEARPAPGFHELTVMDQTGSMATRRFEVLLRND
ncbi:MAG: penicillin-binding protein 1C [Spirochaetota bacterium]